MSEAKPARATGAATTTATSRRPAVTLPVAYNPNAPQPKRWLRFLSELLDQEDIPTLQEFMGYCLIPTTKAQKMLMIIGKGGEGKSRVGVVLRALLGDSVANGNLNKVETNRFARADLEHTLLMVDDDMKTEGLPQTNYLKSMITAELPMDLEKKGQQSYQGDLHVRFLGFGNGSLKALYDRSDGFFRRQIILTTKKKPKDRIDDPFLSEKLVAEKEGIFLWMKISGKLQMSWRIFSGDVPKVVPNPSKNRLIMLSRLIQMCLKSVQKDKK